ELRVAYWPADEAQAKIATQAGTQAIARLKHTLGLELDQRIHIDLCHTNKEFDEQTAKKNDPWVQGRAFPRQNRVVVKAIGPVRIGKLVAHEILHILLQHKLDETGARASRWLHEGLAKYATGDLPMEERQLLGQTAAAGELLSINELEAAFGGSPQQVSLAYAQSYTLVDYLASLEGKAGLSGFLEELGNVGEVERALIRAYQMPISQLEQQWLREIARIYLPQRSPHILDNWVWIAIVVLFVAAVITRLARARVIRRRMQEEERLRQLTESEAPAIDYPEEGS
ncbi:MAG: hypothetical protein KAW89_03165, partial [Armatimonadetes bacterium]|nr:hypothetical protein [Armatimonadota bacterium]